MPSRRSRTLIVAATLLVPLALAAFAILGRRDPARRGDDGAPAPGPDHVTEAPLTRVAVPPLFESPIEELRELARPGGDRFAEEAIAEDLADRLASLRAFLTGATGGDGGADDAAALFADGLRATPLVPSSERAVRRGGGISVFIGSPDPTSRPIDARRLAREVDELLAPADGLDLVELKVVSVVGPLDARSAVETDVMLRLGRRRPGGRSLQWNGRWAIEWSPSPRRIASLRVVEWERVVFERTPFTDVTVEALGSNRSYREQLVPSIDWFRDRLDAATGIDVYGHNGVAVGDLDGDGLDDIYLPEPAGLPNLLFRNNGDGTFSDISRDSGADLLNGGSCALILDVDNDGDRDLFVVGEGSVVVLASEGGRFRPLPVDFAPRERGATAISAVAEDYDRDGLVDVFVTSYSFWRGHGRDLRVASRLPVPYHEAHNGASNFLLRNRGDGRFEDVTARAGLDRDNRRFTFAAAWGDYDADGFPDLYVANDFGSNSLFRNLGDGTFDDVTAAAGVADIGPGMSVAWEDYDGDGDLDLYAGNMFSAAGRRVTGTEDYKASDTDLQGLYRRHARGNSLFQNRGDGTFEDVSLASGAYFGRWAWASGFVDFNLDGREDIYVQNGFVTNARTHDL